MLWLGLMLGMMLWLLLGMMVGTVGLPVHLLVFVVELVTDAVHRVRAHLLAAGRHDAEIMLGVLEVVLGGDAIARGLGVASKREILLVDLIGAAADFALGAARVECLISGIRWPIVAAGAITGSLAVRYLSHAVSIAVMSGSTPVLSLSACCGSRYAATCRRRIEPLGVRAPHPMQAPVKGKLDGNAAFSNSFFQAG